LAELSHNLFFGIDEIVRAGVSLMEIMSLKSAPSKLRNVA
jgi:hypothetical protein